MADKPLSEEEKRERDLQLSESTETTGTMRIHTPQTSHQPGFAGRRNTPSPMFKGLSTALMQGAFEKFGQAFTATGDVRADRANDQGRMQGFRDAGATVASRLEDRWFRMEYENFQSNEVEPFIGAKRRSLDDFKVRNDLLNNGQILGPDGQIQQMDVNTVEGRDTLRRARTSLFQEFYSVNADMDMSLANEAFKYSHNPIIDSRIQAIVEAGSKQLMQIAAPKEQLEGMQAQQGMRLADEAQQTNQQLADAATERNVLAKQQAGRTQTITQMLDDPNIGVQRILQEIETGVGRHLLELPATKVYIEEGKEILRSQLHQQRMMEQIASGKIEKKSEYFKTDEANTAAVESLIAMNGSALQRAAVVELLRATNPQAAIDAEKYSPQFYELVQNAESATGKKKIISDKRLSKAEEKNNIKGWEEVMKLQLKAYMDDPKNDPNIEAAITELVDVWLPQAITGAVRSPAGANLLATQSVETEGYRFRVQKAMRLFLETNFYKISDIAGELNVDARRKARIKGLRRKGGIGRSILRLLDD